MQFSIYIMSFLSPEITVGYVQTAVTVLERDGVAQLTINITMPTRAVQIETTFSLLLNNNISLGPFNNYVRQHFINLTIVNDNIPEDAKVFNVCLTLDPADRARLGNRLTVSPDVATVTIQDDDGKELFTRITYFNTLTVKMIYRSMMIFIWHHLALCV